MNLNLTNTFKNYILVVICTYVYVKLVYCDVVHSVFSVVIVLVSFIVYNVDRENNGVLISFLS